jgi:dihydropteroate synthase
VLELGTRTFVMGIVNVTPDSFSDGGRFADAGAAHAHAVSLLDDGADVIDLGGESTRPGATLIPVEEELRRVLPVLTRLVAEGVTNVSVDTRRAEVAAAALDAGASWINDVGGLSDPAMARTCAGADGLVVMHHRNASFDAVEDHVTYGDVVAEVAGALAAMVAAAEAEGLAREKVVVDPGIGFGKTVADNVRLLDGCGVLRRVAPVLVGPSRKRFLGALGGRDHPGERDAATVGACCLAALRGADLVRVHDVAGVREALSVIDATRGVS